MRDLEWIYDESGWRDALSPRIAQLIKEYGFESKGIESMFDFIEFDEGRDPLASQAWKE